jgi:hypothetical protein
MTCVWDSLCKGLLPLQYNPTTLINHLKQYNTPPSDIMINGQCMTCKQLEENVAHINEIQVCHDGYLCGLYDPLIVAYCHVFKVNVDHNMQGVVAIFTISGSTRHIRLFSSSSHMICSNLN